MCGNSLIIELPADHRNGGGGDLHGSSASVTVAWWPSSRPHNSKMAVEVKGLKGEGELAVVTAIWEHC